MKLGKNFKLKLSILLLILSGNVAFADNISVVLPNNSDQNSENSVSIGKALVNEKEKGGIAIGNGAVVKHDDQDAKIVNLPFLGPTTVRPFAPGNGLGGIAIGEKAFVHTMTAGEHERIIAFNHSDDRTQMVGGIAIGDKTHARIGTIDLGNRDYVGKIGDINFAGDSLNVIDGVGSTTIGTNSINSGNFATISGAYNAITNRPTQGGLSGYLSNISRATQGLGSTITGAFNSIENNFAKDHAYSGLANNIVGIANKVNKSNGIIVMGAGNEVSNSYLTANNSFMSAVSNPPKTIKDLADKIRTFSQENAMASVGVFGGANKVTSAAFSSINGVGNTLKGDPNAKNDTLKFNDDEKYPGYAAFNMISGYKNNENLSSHTLLFGSYNSIDKSNHIIGLGNKINVASTDEKTANNDVFIGFNTKAETLIPKQEKKAEINLGEDGKWYKVEDIKDSTYFKGTHFTPAGYYKSTDSMRNHPIASITDEEKDQYFDVKPMIKKGIENTMVLGNNVMANEDNSVYLGTNSTEALAGKTAGNGIYKASFDHDELALLKKAYKAKNNNYFDSFAGLKADGIVSIGSEGHERRLENVAAGLISANSTDAINGSQLYALIKNFKLDGGSGDSPFTYVIDVKEGKVTKPVKVVKNEDGSYYIEGDTKKTPVDANKVYISSKKPDNTVPTDKQSITGEKVTNIAPGTAPNDAVNVSQLEGVKYIVDGNTKKIATNSKNIKTNTGNISINSKNIKTNTDNISINSNNIAANTTKINGKADKNAGNLTSDDVNAWKNKLGVHDVQGKDLTSSTIEITSTDNPKAEKPGKEALLKGLNIEVKDRSITYNKLSQDVENQIKDNADNIKKLGGAVASNTAIANIPQVGGDRRFSIGAGVGYYKKNFAVALGISGQDKNKRVIYKLSGGLSTAKEFTIGAGINYNFGELTESVKEQPTVVVAPSEKPTVIKEVVEKPVKQEISPEQLKALKDEIKKELQKELVENYQTKKFIINGFNVDIYRLTKDQKEQVKKVVEYLNKNYKDRIIDIAGYTDTSASDRYNLELGLRRANMVANAMKELGLDSSFVIRKVSSYGYNNNVSTNKTISGKADNRRVEINLR